MVTVVSTLCALAAVEDQRQFEAPHRENFAFCPIGHRRCPKKFRWLTWRFSSQQADGVRFGLWPAIAGQEGRSNT
jgi:hypothetical protein